MKKIDLDLLKSIGKPRTIIDGMLDRQIQALEAGLGHNAAGAGNKLVSLFVKGGYRLQLSSAVVVKKMKAISNLSEDEIIGLIEKLHESGLLRQTTSKQYELANNFMARQAHEKVEAENRVLRTIQSTINDRMGREELLDQSYLNYITPSLSQLDLSPEERVFIEDSKTSVRRRRVFLSAIFWVLFILMAIFATGAIYNYIRANKALGVSQGHVQELEAEKAKTEEARIEALNAQGEAEEARNEAEAERIIALEAKEMAEQLRNAAIADRDSITYLKQEADALIVKLDSSRNLAEQRANTAEQLETAAVNSKAESERLTKKAELLNKIITSRIAANRSLQIEDNHMRSLVAYEAYKINKSNSEGDTYHPSIVKAMYTSIEANNEGFFVEKKVVGSIKDIEVAPSGDVFYTTGSDGNVREWKVGNWNQVGKPDFKSVITLGDKEEGVLNTLSLSPDGSRLLVAGDGNSFKLLNTKNKAVSKYTYTTEDEIIYKAEFDEEGNFCGLGKEHAYFRFEGAFGDVKTKEFSYTRKDDDQSALITLDKLASKISLFRKVGKENRVYVFQGAFGEKYSQYELVVQVFDGHTNKENEYTLANGSAEEVDYGELTAVEFKQIDEKNGLLVYGFKKGRVMIVRLDNLDENDDIVLGEKEIFKAHQAAITDVKLSKSGEFLAIASYDGSVSVWDMGRYTDASYQPMIFKMPSWALSVAFAHDDDVLITGCKDGSLYFWNINPDDYASYLCSSLHSGKDDYVKRQATIKNKIESGEGVRIKSGMRSIRYNEMKVSDYERYFGEIEDTSKKEIEICK